MAIAEQQITVGPLSWFYREATPANAGGDRLPIVLLHGLVSQSYSWRGVMPDLAELGFRVVAPDWIGHGFSCQPDKRDFAYTPDAFVQALSDFLDALEIPRCHLVAQGFLGTAGVQFALRQPDRVERLAIVNAPVSPVARLPWKIRQFAIPLAGDMLTQDPLLVDRTLEGGGPYQVGDADLDVYRRPFLKSSSAGRALMMTVKGLNLPSVTQEIAAGLPQWSGPVLLIWGTSDPWLSVDQAKACAETLQDGQLDLLDQVGHYAQEDWAEKVVGALNPFLRKMAI